MQENIAVISVKNIKSNVAAFRSLLSPRVKLYAVVKANAYGHGAERVAEGVQGGVDGFVVTSVTEGVSLRIGGAVKDVLVLTPPIGLDDVLVACAHGLTLTVCSFSSLRVIAEAVQKFGICTTVHIKANTGMNRLGFCGAPLKRLCSEISQTDGVEATGLYSHLYAPDNALACEKQRENFLSAKSVAEEILGPLTCHLSATGGILRGDKYHFDGVRLGIGMYGYLPNGVDGENLQLRPAMRLYTHVLQSHRFTGGGVGYAAAEKEYGNLTACRLGYADGLFRNGGALQAVGNLCMDNCVREGKSGYGEKKQVFSSVRKLAESSNTIPYEVLCAATKRAVFEYVDD